MKKSSRQSAITKVLLLVSWAFLFFTACSAIPIYLVLFYLNPMLDPNTPDDIEHEISNNILLGMNYSGSFPELTLISDPKVKFLLATQKDICFFQNQNKFLNKILEICWFMHTEILTLILKITKNFSNSQREFHLLILLLISYPYSYLGPKNLQSEAEGAPILPPPPHPLFSDLTRSQPKLLALLIYPDHNLPFAFISWHPLRPSNIKLSSNAPTFTILNGKRIPNNVSKNL